MMNRRFFYGANANHTPDSKEFALGFGMRGIKGCYVIVLGWGYDAEVPLRPWPQVWSKDVAGAARVGASLLGFFVAANMTR